jgi:hypothetical protein
VRRRFGVSTPAARLGFEALLAQTQTDPVGEDTGRSNGGAEVVGELVVTRSDTSEVLRRKDSTQSAPRLVAQWQPIENLGARLLFKF